MSYKTPFEKVLCLLFMTCSRNFFSDKQDKVKKYPSLEKVAKELVFSYF